VAVREQYPNAFIVYKPHPDIAKSVRFSGGNSADHQKTYDLALSNIDLMDCLQWVDSLHTISSLSGFEALIRGLPVYCYGLPFYAGWGLTTDRHNCERRSRKLALAELIAGTLILYPTYIHPTSKLYCSPEALIAALHEMQGRKKNIMQKISHFLVERSVRTAMGMVHRIKRI
jgi:capsular polysaccharide export protein